MPQGRQVSTFAGFLSRAWFQNLWRLRWNDRESTQPARYDARHVHNQAQHRRGSLPRNHL